MLSKSPYIYTPSKGEITLATMIATARCELKESRNVKSNKYTASRSEVDTHVLGILGEFAVSTVLGIPVRMPVTLGGDDGHDLTSAQVGKISVKTRSRAKYDFALTTPESGKDWDIGILVCPKGMEIAPPYEFAALRLVGWLTKDEFMKRSHREDFGYGPRLSVKNSALNPMVDLKHTKGRYSIDMQIQLHGLNSTFREVTCG